MLSAPNFKNEIMKFHCQDVVEPNLILKNILHSYLQWLSYNYHSTIIHFFSRKPELYSDKKNKKLYYELAQQCILFLNDSDVDNAINNVIVLLNTKNELINEVSVFVALLSDFFSTYPLFLKKVSDHLSQKFNLSNLWEEFFLNVLNTIENVDPNKKDGNSILSLSHLSQWLETMPPSKMVICLISYILENSSEFGRNGYDNYSDFIKVLVEFKSYIPEDKKLLIITKLQQEAEDFENKYAYDALRVFCDWISDKSFFIRDLINKLSSGRFQKFECEYAFWNLFNTIEQWIESSDRANIAQLLLTLLDEGWSSSVAIKCSVILKFTDDIPEEQRNQFIQDAYDKLFENDWWDNSNRQKACDLLAGLKDWISREMLPKIIDKLQEMLNATDNDVDEVAGYACKALRMLNPLLDDRKRKEIIIYLISNLAIQRDGFSDMFGRESCQMLVLLKPLTTQQQQKEIVAAIFSQMGEYDNFSAPYDAFMKFVVDLNPHEKISMLSKLMLADNRDATQAFIQLYKNMETEKILADFFPENIIKNIMTFAC